MLEHRKGKERISHLKYEVVIHHLGWKQSTPMSFSLPHQSDLEVSCICTKDHVLCGAFFRFYSHLRIFHQCQELGAPGKVPSNGAQELSSCGDVARHPVTWLYSVTKRMLLTWIQESFFNLLLMGFSMTLKT